MHSPQKISITATVITGFLITACGKNEPPEKSTNPNQPAPTSQAAVQSEPVKAPTEDVKSIKVKFVELRKKRNGEFIVLRFTNSTDKVIAGIRGSVLVKDADGNIVRGCGYTDQLFNKKPGESVELPILQIKPDGPLKDLRDSLGTLTYEYAARKITFTDH